jgi:hypothetical protein
MQSSITQKIFITRFIGLNPSSIGQPPRNRSGRPLESSHALRSKVLPSKARKYVYFRKYFRTSGNKRVQLYSVQCTRTRRATRSIEYVQYDVSVARTCTAVHVRVGRVVLE